MTSFKPLIPSKPDRFSVILPGISPEAALLSEKLLSRNSKEFHCFFNDKKFHNHLIHHLLAAYSLGASKEKIQEIFDIHAEYQRPLPPSIGQLTRDNYVKHLGDSDAYTSFLTLFQSEIEKSGALDTVRRWVWSGDFLARTIGGAYHPVIHIGYGLEFNIPGIVAEGLAMAACTQDSYIEIIPRQPDLNTSTLFPAQAQGIAENATSSAMGYMSSLVDQFSTRLGISDRLATPNDTKHPVDDIIEKKTEGSLPYLNDNSLLKIFNDIRKDPIFDNLFKSSDDGKMKTLFNNKTTSDRIKHYANQWNLEENSKDVQHKFKELYTLAGIALGSTGIRKDYPKVLRLDFFLMHTLTSSEFLHQYISRITPSESVALLHAHLSATIVHYITSGRPDFYIEGLLEYNSPSSCDSSNNNWLVVYDKALTCKEPHVIKVVRSCAVAQVIYGPHEDAHLNQMWLKVAQMAIDKDGDWDFSGVGFDDTWSDKNTK